MTITGHDTLPHGGHPEIWLGTVRKRKAHTPSSQRQYAGHTDSLASTAGDTFGTGHAKAHRAGAVPHHRSTTDPAGLTALSPFCYTPHAQHVYLVFWLVNPLPLCVQAPAGSSSHTVGLTLIPRVLPAPLTQGSVRNTPLPHISTLLIQALRLPNGTWS